MYELCMNVSCWFVCLIIFLKICAADLKTMVVIDKKGSSTIILIITLNLLMSWMRSGLNCRYTNE